VFGGMEVSDARRIVGDEPVMNFDVFTPRRVEYA